MPEPSTRDDSRVADALLRLLRDKPRQDDLEHLGRLLEDRPDDLLALCQQNLIVLRSLAALEAHGVSVGGAAVAWQEKERRRIEHGLATVGKVGEHFDREDLAYMVIKTGDHFPDQGHDIDLLLRDGGVTAERIMAGELDASRLERSLSEVLSAKSNWRCGAATVEIHIGRLGQVGEHRHLAEEIFSHRRQARIGPVDTWVPAAEDRMILAMLQRIYRHFNFRICDLINVSGLLEDKSLNWGDLWRRCRASGIDYGVGIGIAMVADRLRSLGDDLPLPEGGPIPWPSPYRISFRRGYYRFPLRGVVPAVFAGQVGGSVRRGAVGQLSRLALLGLLMAVVGVNIRFFPGISVWRKLW